MPGIGQSGQNGRRSSAYEVNVPRLIFAGSARLGLPCFRDRGNHTRHGKEVKAGILDNRKALFAKKSNYSWFFSCGCVGRSVHNAIQVLNWVETRDYPEPVGRTARKTTRGPEWGYKPGGTSTRVRTWWIMRIRSGGVVPATGEGAVIPINGSAYDNKPGIIINHNIPSTPNPTSTFVPMRTRRLSPRHGTANPFRP